MSSNFGRAYQRDLSKAKAQLLLKRFKLNVDLPKIGYEIELATSDCNNYHLMLSNVSGSFCLRCCNCTVDKWQHFFKFSPDKLSGMLN